MANKPGLVARMFGRTQKHPVVTKLFTHAIGQPLLVHPALGEALIGAYLSGAVDVPEQLVEGPADGGAAAGDAQAGVVRVLNISGGLVNRPMPDMCGPGPLSYEHIGDAYDAAMADENVKAIVLRMSSPGGMAAGCFDLADRMYAHKGTKPVYAMVDDYAYSAAYGIAAVADEIWITRTGGAGSVGVICWHMEHSVYDAKIGLKVTPIFSGDRKVDFNPHAPLSEEAQAGMQAEVDRLRTLFVESVATYRGVDADVIRATEAGIFFGPEAVAAGMADKVGTMRDLIAHINAPAQDEAANDDAAADEQGTDDEQVPVEAAASPLVVNVDVTADAEQLAADLAGIEQTAADQALKLDRADKAVAVAAASIAPDLAMALLRLEFPAAEATARIEHALAVADLCAAAGLRDIAPNYVTRHTDIEQVRTELASAAAMDGLPQIVTALPAGVSAGAPSTMHTDVYSRRRVAAAGTGQ